MTDRDPGRAAAFEFARRLRDSRFRNYLAGHGHTGAEHVVIALDHEPIYQVIHRMMHNDTPSPCLIAIPHGEEQFGFRLLVAEEAPRRRWPWHRVEPIRVSPESSIGMLYLAFERCGEYVPGHWSKPVIFERVPAPA